MKRLKRYIKLQKYYFGMPSNPPEYKIGRLVEDASFYDSIEDCENPPSKPITYERWITVDNEYVCDGYDKYTKEQKQTSTDGINWTNTDDYRQGSLIQTNSTDCGYGETTWVEVPDEYFCEETEIKNKIEYILKDGISSTNSALSLWKSVSQQKTLKYSELQNSTVYDDLINDGYKVSTIYDVFTSFSMYGDENYINSNQYLFENKNNIKKVSLNTTTVVNNSFQDCSELEEVELNRIYYGYMGYNFNNCPNLKYIDLSNYDPWMSKNKMQFCFSNCPNLEKIKCTQELKDYINIKFPDLEIKDWVITN